MATIKDVARRAGVSIATVSRVVHEKAHVNPETRLRVKAAIRELGYEPNAVARSMIRKRTFAIGLLISDIANPFFTNVVRGVEDIVHPHGYTVILGNSDEDPEKERRYLQALAERQIDGLIIASTAQNNDRIRELIVRRRIPVVLMDRDLDIPEADAVAVDNEAAACSGVHRLLAAGHRHIGAIVGPRRIPTSVERLLGYRRALQEAGLAYDPGLVFYGDFKESGGEQGIRHLFSRPDPPTALFTVNNLTTLGALLALREQGLRIPEDVSIVGFDDLPWSRVVDPPLSVIRQPTYLLGTTAAQLILSRLSGRERPEAGRRVSLQTELVDRGSIAPPRPGP